jgi:hypothetical protein
MELAASLSVVTTVDVMAAQASTEEAISARVNRLGLK